MVPGWENSQGYFVNERETLALLIKENCSVGRVFEVVVAQAFTRPHALVDASGLYKIWEPGSRAWSLRQLAATCNLAVNTVVRALKRLERIGLIKRVASKLGTVIQALKFYQYRRKNPNMGETPPPMTRSGDTGVSTVDHYRSASSKIFNRSEDLVDVRRPERMRGGGGSFPKTYNIHPQTGAIEWVY